MSHRLLLADDSITIQRVIELTFSEEDVEVIAVSDGQQAIEQIRAKRPDIVLADLGMPERDGYEVAAFVKRDPNLAHIPVVLLTGAFEPVDEARARAIGCDGILVKPFEPQMVINRVRDLLAGERPASLWATPPDHRAAAPTSALGTDKTVSGADVPRSPGEPGESPGTGAFDASLDEYFERLDETIGSIGSSPEAPPPSGPPVNEQLRDWVPGREINAPAQQIGLAEYPGLDEAMRAGEDISADEPRKDVPGSTADEILAAGVAAAQAAPPASTTPVPPIALADAFAALLAAEQGWPAPQVSAATDAASARVTQQLVADVTQRVLDQMSDRIVRQTVVDILTQVAERRVREEIDRIKADSS